MTQDFSPQWGNIRTDDGATGKRNNFEAITSYLLTYDTVAHKRTAGTKRTVTEISSADAELSAFGSKKSVGISGVPLCYHTTEEYENLNKDERVDLRKWQKRDKKKGKGRAKKDSSETATAPAVEKLLDKLVVNKLAEMQNESADDDKARSYIMSLFEDKKEKELYSSTSSVAASKKVTLTGILKRAKNAKKE